MPALSVKRLQPDRRGLGTREYPSLADPRAAGPWQSRAAKLVTTIVVPRVPEEWRK